MFDIVLTAIITFMVSGLFGYLVHRSLHQKWAGSLYQKHMTHHRKLYPPHDYLSDQYRQPDKDNTVRIFALFAIPVVFLPMVLGLVGVMPWLLVITSLLVMGLMGFLHDYLHDAFHIRNHPLTQMPLIRKWFARWNTLHFQHHVDMGSNYGIFSFYWDRLFGTFRSSKGSSAP